MKIANKEQLDTWMNERREMGRDLISVKGEPPSGATYDDGDPITRPINIAWKDTITGEVFPIEYDLCHDS